jgi:hypothetical protein
VTSEEKGWLVVEVEEKKEEEEKIKKMKGR